MFTEKWKSLSSTGLLVLQLGLAIFFCGSQFLHLINEGVTNSASIVLFVSVEFFTLLNLGLAWNAYLTKSDSESLKVLGTYGLWALLWTPNFAIVFWAFLKRPSELWTPDETIAAIAVAIGLLVVWGIGKMQGLSLRDPMVKGGNAMVFKAVPQLFQGLKFAMFGPAGWSGWAVATGHVTIGIRILQNLFSRGKAKQDRNRKATLMSEIGNELSWLIATAAWLGLF